MEQTGKGSAFFYGWWIVAISMVVLFVTLGLGYYSFGIFFKPLIHEFGWSRRAVSGAMSVFLIAWGLACPLTGRWSDSHGPRRIIIAGSMGLGFSFCLLSLTGSLWHLYLLYACAGAASAVCSEIPTSAAVSNWFSQKRGIAMGIATTGMGFGGLVLAPLTGRSILIFGWRITYIAMGLLAWGAILPPVFLFMKNRPRDIGLMPDGEKMTPPARAGISEPKPKSPNDGDKPGVVEAGEPSRGSAALLLIGIAFSLVSFGLIGVVTHEVPFIIDLGISPGTAATMLGLTAGIGTAGKLGFGHFADRFSPKSVLYACIGLQIAGVFILMQSTGLAMVWAFVVVFSFAMGGTNTLRPLVIGEIFGTTSFGRTLGTAELMRRLGAAAGPFLAGYIFDVTRSYQYAFISFIAAYLLGMAALFFIRPAGTGYEAAVRLD
jgi:MFS family permease